MSAAPTNHLPCDTAAIHSHSLMGFLRLIWRFIRFSFVARDKILLLVLIAQGTGILWVVSALATAKCVDEGLRAGSRGEFLRWALIWFGVQLTLYLIYNLQTIMSAHIKLQVELVIKRRLFEHFQRLSLHVQQARPIGENMFRLNNDTSLAAGVAAAALPDFLSRIITILTTGSLLFTLNPMIALFVALYVVLFFGFAHIVTNFSTRYQADQRHAGERATAMLQENLSAYLISKAMARERHELRRYFGRSAEFVRATARYGMANGFCMIGLRHLWEWFILLVQTLFCGWLVIRGQLSVGEYVAVGHALSFAVAPLQILVYMLIWFRISAVTLRRVLETLDSQPEITTPPQAIRLKRPQGEIVFDNVSLRYEPGGPEVLRNLSLRLAPGSKTAIVGPSGAGKSSLFNLVMRYYDPTAGRILIDGIDLRTLDLDAYRAQVGIVLQENFMYSASIRDNILFGKPTATTAELARAVELAGLGPLLCALPDGIDTVLKEGGDLSAGQIQRIGIARAVIRDPRFLFLDEATAALDPVTADEVLSQLRAVEANRTRLIIAHNIASVADADQIVVLERGELVQSGRHTELLAQPGIYQVMWQAEAEKMARVDLEADHA